MKHIRKQPLFKGLWGQVFFQHNIADVLSYVNQSESEALHNGQSFLTVWRFTAMIGQISLGVTILWACNPNQTLL